MMRKSMIRLLIFVLVALPMLGSYGKEASAASSRVAVIKEMKGSVKVNKAGGSKEFTAFAKMSLNEGDVLAVGSDSSAVLQFSNGTSEDDRMTVASNSKLTFSKLSNKNGTTTKVSLFNGSVWADVKSIENEDDKFTLETPTSIMGVRGTHLLVSVDPVSGATRLTVAAGVVSAQTTDSNDPRTQEVIPTKKALVTKQPKGGSEITIAQVDLELLFSQSDKTIIEAIAGAASEIAQENVEKRNAYREAVGGAYRQNEESNVQNLVGAILALAVQNKIINPVRTEELLRQVKAATGKNLDLENSALLLSDDEKARQQLQNRKDQEAHDRAKALKDQEKAVRDQDALLQQRLKNNRDKQEKENNDSLAEKRKRALEEYEKQLSQAEKQRFEEQRKAREAGQNTSTGNGTGGGGGGGGASSSPSPSPSSSSSQSPSPSPSGEVPANDARLSAVAIQGHFDPLSKPDAMPINVLYAPSFQADVYSYSVSVEADIVSLTVKPTVKETHATVKINGQSLDSVTGSVSVPLVTGTNAIEIVVTAQDSTTKKTYRFDIARSTSVPLLNWKTTLLDGSELAWNASPLDSNAYNTGVATTISGFNMQLDYNEAIIERVEAKIIDPNSAEQLLSWTASGQAKPIGGLANGLYKVELTAFDAGDATVGNTLTLWFHNNTAAPDWSTIARPFTVNRVEAHHHIIGYQDPGQSIMTVNANVRKVRFTEAVGAAGIQALTEAITVNGQAIEPDGVIPLSYGENTVRVPVVDKTGYYSGTYQWRLIRFNDPEGVNGWAIAKSDSTTDLWTNITDLDASGKYRYFVNVPIGVTKFTIIVNSDADKTVSATLTDVQSGTDMPLSRTDQFKEFTFNDAGYYRYLLKMTVEGVYEEYELVFVVGSPDWENLISGNLKVDGVPVMPTVGGFSVVIPPGQVDQIRYLDFFDVEEEDVKVFRGTEEITGGVSKVLGILATGSQNDYEIRLYDPTHRLAPKLYPLTVFVGGVPNELVIDSIAALDDQDRNISMSRKSPSEPWNLTFVSDSIDPTATAVSMSVQLADIVNGEIKRVRVGTGASIPSIDGEFAVDLVPGTTSLEIVVQSRLTGREVCYVVNLFRA
ncbi:cadherin-like beta sandwich domain-containing protein [Cohnella cholangitidis]|uniref:FecR family protein n=1 Tax=Cohnella cholangitidis TaxID=2598458 RepID=A0A7G5C3V6_9BACL|nr:cadherin-like beta sandwich domain-containing protein [Cohnella cholangitidis]QMV43890.1 hypothetical protein FPL14_23985 [Cohnella cholangitidis]